MDEVVVDPSITFQAIEHLAHLLLISSISTRLTDLSSGNHP